MPAMEVRAAERQKYSCRLGTAAGRRLTGGGPAQWRDRRKLSWHRVTASPCGPLPLRTAQFQSSNAARSPQNRPDCSGPSLPQMQRHCRCQLSPGRVGGALLAGQTGATAAPSGPSVSACMPACAVHRWLQVEGWQRGSREAGSPRPGAVHRGASTFALPPTSACAAMPLGEVWMPHLEETLDGPERQTGAAKNFGCRRLTTICRPWA